MYSTAILHASNAAWKQSVGDVGAITGIGLSPLRPKSTCSKSVCSVLVGKPVDGPPRITSTITKGSSSITAKFMASDFKQMPGPDVEVTPNVPTNEAPIVVQQAANSSSHCMVTTPMALCFASSLRMSVAGVMG